MRLRSWLWRRRKGSPQQNAEEVATARDARTQPSNTQTSNTQATNASNASAQPNVAGLVGELTSPTYSFNGSKFQIEAKDQIKKRLGKSPDLADALALTLRCRICRRIAGALGWW